jgi:hypothetical protein
MRVAFATCRALPDGWPDDHAAAKLLGAEFRSWDDESVDWRRYDRVVLRSVWNYSRRVDEFLEWCRAVGPHSLRNRPALVAFNADKRYLRQLSAPVVPTSFVGPGDALPSFSGEVVIKPNVSAGARDTGRFAPAARTEAVALIERIRARGRVALVQPYLTAVDRTGETALVFIGGQLSHVLTKHAVLRDHGVAPMIEGEIGVAQAMLDDDLVTAGTADELQRSLANDIHDQISGRFGPPLYARIDLAPGLDGSPVLLELELIEPSLYLALAPGASERLSAAVANS